MVKKIFISLLIIFILGLAFYLFHPRLNHVATNNLAVQKQVKKVDIPKNSTTIQPTTNTQSPTKNPNGTGLMHSQSIDTNGQGVSNTPKNQWVTSVSGNITLQQPVAGSTVYSGLKVIGTAKVKSVDYRLSDNSIGVLTTGTLNVVNGKFSGILYFTPKSNAGQLDIFNTNSRGIEINEIDIGVEF